MRPTSARSSSEVGLLPRVHGSALFTRGETQALVATTLGTAEDEQRVEMLTGMVFKKFMLHYNFPPFSVGEVKFLRSPGRREIGHGALAERALRQVMPPEDKFPYTVRIVSDIMESNGSSSMASVCGGCLSLMDAGVPIKAPVAGIAMGLIKEGEKIAILSDILGDEDHLGDMDFKVCGTAAGITSIQMDIKIGGVTREILERALSQAADGRKHILAEMAKAISQPRQSISAYAPRITTIKIRPERIKDIIGPGGKTIKDITARTGTSINIEDDGSVSIASPSQEKVEAAIKMIRAPHPGGGGRQDLPRHGPQDRRVRRLRGDLPGHRRPHPHLRALGQAREERLRRPLRGRGGAGEGHLRRPRREDPALPQGGARGRRRQEARGARPRASPRSRAPERARRGHPHGPAPRGDGRCR